MEESLFPLSPTADQKVGEDNMECAAADLILGETESGSLFNDSLDSDHNSHQVVEKSTNRGSATVPSSDQEPCNLDDSLNFDDTQLPYSESNAEVAISTPLSCSTVSDGKAGGFVLAKNITVSEESAVKEENEKENALQPNTEVDASDTKKSTSVSSRGRASATEKASRVVPSFGRRKNKSQVSPEAVKRDQKSSDKKTASDSRVPTDHQCNDEESLREDQCVPQTNDTTEQQPQIKPQFGTSSSKVKPAVKKSASSSSRERKNKSKTLPNITSTDGEDKCMATNTTAGGGNDDHTKTETATTAGSDKGIVLPKSEKREKKSADQEQKKQEREEKRREAERKKLEREQKKREAEAKKAERERLKRERQLELEKKKAEREQKKIEQALKKAQRMATKTEQGKASRERINNKDKSKVSNGAKDSHSLELQSEKEEREMERETKQEKVAEGDEGASPSRANVVGVTEPDESASLPITPNPTSHNTATDLEPGSVAEGNGLSSSMDEMEPQKSAAMLPQHAADEGVCDTKNERDKHCDSENEPKRLIEDARLPSTEKQNEAVLRERNTADQSTPSYKKENCGKENIKPMEEATSANDSCSVSVEKLKIVFGKSGKGAKKGSNGAGSSSGTNRDLAKKGMSKKAYTTASVRKQKVSSGDGRIASTSSSTKSKKRVCTREEGGSSDGERERKCSRVSNSVGPVWVQCDRASCQKWRKLRDCSDPLSLPDSWTCSINTDPERSTCSAEEETWSEEMGDSQEFIETPFVPGSLVWAKMDSYPWWPAMIEEDPDNESYYQLGKWSKSNIPVRYHVVFFDTPVSRGWISSFHVQPYTAERDNNTLTGTSVPQKLRHGLKDAKKQASRASTMTITARLNECSFSKRFRQISGKKRRAKTLHKELSDEEDQTYRGEAKRSKLSDSKVFERRSTRLGRGVAKSVEGEGGDGGEGVSVGQSETLKKECEELDTAEGVGGCEDGGEVEGEFGEDEQDNSET